MNKLLNLFLLKSNSDNYRQADNPSDNAQEHLSSNLFKLSFNFFKDLNDLSALAKQVIPSSCIKLEFKFNSFKS